MNVIEAIQARRAVRSYSPRPVDDATIRSLLRAAVQAPNALNEQLWVFAVVQNRDQLRRWSDCAKAMLLEQAPPERKTRHYNPQLADPAFNIFYDAGTLIVIGCRERQTYTDADCWLAAQNVMLAACESGLGSCPIGLAIPMLNTRAVKEELRFPASAVAVAPIIIGYANAAAPVVLRADPSILSWSR